MVRQPGSSKNVASAAEYGLTRACQPRPTQLFQSPLSQRGIAGQDYPVILSFLYRTGLLPFSRLKAHVTMQELVSLGDGPRDMIK